MFYHQVLLNWFRQASRLIFHHIRDNSKPFIQSRGGTWYPGVVCLATGTQVHGVRVCLSRNHPSIHIIYIQYCFKSLYIYIYILGSHTAPYGACEVAQSTARSNAQFEAERFRKEFQRKQKTMSKVLSKGKETCSKVLSNEKEACSNSDFECSVASKHARAGISSAQWPRMGKSMLEQWFRALSRRQTPQKASSSNYFERPAAKKQARALISSAQWLRSTFEHWFRALSRRSCACAVFSSAAELVWRLPVPTQAENLHSYYNSVWLVSFRQRHA
jgi:hypothetical protein